MGKQRVPPLCFTGGMRLGCGSGRTQPARLRALCDVLRCMAERASSVSDETRCGGVLEAMHNRSPFSIKPLSNQLQLVLWHARCVCLAACGDTVTALHGKESFRTW